MKPPLQKLKPTHQFIPAPFMDVVAWQLNAEMPQPFWCRNIKWVPGAFQWEVFAVDGSKVTAKHGDWAVAAIDDDSMCILTDDEFRRLYRMIRK